MLLTTSTRCQANVPPAVRQYDTAVPISIPLTPTSLLLPVLAGGTVQEGAEAVDRKGEEMQRKAQQHQGQEKLKEDTPGMSRDKI